MHRLVACVLALASSQARAAVGADGVVADDANVCRIVVLNLVASNLADTDKEMPALLTQTLAQQVSADSGCQVITPADLTEMLDFEAAKQLCTDSADSCVAEIGSALGAERIIVGTLGRLGADFVVNARLMNVKSSVVEARAEQVVPGAPEQLRLAAQNVGRQLFGVPLVATAAQDELPPLVYVGGAVGALGVVGVLVGSALAGIAENDLSQAEQTGKEDSIRQGQVGLGVVGVGALLTIVGVVAVVVPMFAE